MFKVVGCAGVLALVACGSSSNNNGVDGGADMHHGPATCTPDGQSAQLAARYGVQANLLANVKVTAGCSGASCLVNTDANAELLLLATITQASPGASATVTAQPCKIVIPPVALKGQAMPLTLSAPKALIASVKPVTSTATLSGPMTCANFNAQPITLVLGASLANVASDPLPGFTQGATPPINFCGGALASCASASATGCVCDQESDSKPGATLNAMNVPGLDDLDLLYVDLRTSVTLQGQIFPAASGQTNPGPQIVGTISGLALDTSVLGCHRTSTGECNASDTGAAAALNPAISQSTNGPSTFTAVPLSASDTCDTLVANEAALFGQ